MLFVNSIFAKYGENMTLLERIKILAKENNTNIKNLEMAAGFGNGTMRRWDNSPPSVDKLLKIANMLNSSMDYLMTGKESLTDSISSDDAEWLSLIHQLPMKAQYEFRGEIKGYLKRFNEEAIQNPELRQAK